ncbi:DUF4138 domain-containing protein [Maribacter sp. PR1]|uniref:DUF4138 domain-containing protein n=1 Tax=Maribacter cobaltidurans TaxID=1178778 RepID=A0ABU7IY50_9FLAO|nr:MULTISPECIES: DUF4138 domain-containing protein [Maribacter]MDC6390537.1 DUF4138 domain-containing protein [Maribacter sp. PR1]MEE1977927.1 DUF4138 domain-containing protein [Maribacter cobaltidurans]
MKNYLPFLLLFLVSFKALRAQSPLDTLYANETKNVALFFPSQIHQAVTGSSHFVFTYNREKGQYFGLLQAQPGAESNLLVLTKDGRVYSYLLKYAKHLSQLNYFVPVHESIGQEHSQVVPESTKTRDSIVPTRKKYYERAAQYLLNLPRESIKSNQKSGIQLALERMVYNGPEVYLVMSIRNATDIPFEVNFLKVYVTQENRQRRTSYQQLEQPILYAFRMPEILLVNQEYRFILVLPKFVLGTKEELEIILQEQNGNRAVDIKTKRR